MTCRAPFWEDPLFRIIACRALAAASVASLLAVFAAPAHALRPFDGTDAAVADPQSIETEFGPLGYVREGDERLIVFPELGINYGAGSGYEFGLEARRIMKMTDEQPTPSPHYDDFEVSMKRILRGGMMQEKKGPSVAGEIGVLLPTSDEKGAGFVGALALTDHLRLIRVHLNAEISRTRTHETGRFGSAIFEIFDHRALHPVVELSLEREGEEPTTKGLLVGALWEVRERLVMDFGVRTSYADQHNAEVRAGMTFGKHVPHGPKMP
jgi:hypothetical protein